MSAPTLATGAAKPRASVADRKAEAARASLSRLAKETGTTSAAVRWHDDLGRVLGWVHWPTAPAHACVFARLGPALPVLTMLSALHNHWWAGRPGVALEVPDELLKLEPEAELIHSALGERQLVTCTQPVRADGSQLVVSIARADGRPFGPRKLRAMERGCAESAAVLAAPFTGAMPRFPVPVAGDHVVELGAAAARPRVSLYLHALLPFFYGAVRRDDDGQIGLPSGLEDDLRRYRADYLRLIAAEPGGFHHAFTKRSRGRTLCLAVQAEPAGRMVLSMHEDISQHARLRLIKAACRELKRDRRSVFTAALLVAEGLHATGEIARCAGFGKLNPASALRLVNQARRVVGELARCSDSEQ